MTQNQGPGKGQSPCLLTLVGDWSLFLLETLTDQVSWKTFVNIMMKPGNTFLLIKFLL